MKTFELSLQENALATSMFRKIGSGAVQYTLGNNGTRYHHNPRLTAEDLSELTDEFSKDPKECLAWARESLFEINNDQRLNEANRQNRLSRYVDAYIQLTLKLDHSAFPPTKSNEVREGVPEYIPDGFVDMGGEDEIDPSFRFGREQVIVDKENILKNYKKLLMQIFSTDYSSVNLIQKKKHMAAVLASAVYRKMPYDHSDKDLGGQVVLSQLKEGVCRHQGLVFQVLCQAVGLQSRVLKTYIDGGRHLTNAVRFNGEWYIYDVTNPDYIIKDGVKVWRPGAYKIGEYPGSSNQIYHVKGKYSGVEHEYRLHKDMYWHIQSTN